MSGEQVKRCSVCGESRPLDAFGKDRGRPDGREHRCRDCRAARRAATYVPRPKPTGLPQMWRHKPGDRFGSLVLVERLGWRNGSGRVLARCDCGAVRQYGLPNLKSGKTQQCSDRTAHADPRCQPNPETYDAAHARLRRVRGSASGYACWRCGKPAEAWAYVHADPEPRRDAEGREAGRPWSPDPDQYRPTCRSCHRAWDEAQRRTAGDGLSLAHVALHAAIQASGPLPARLTRRPDAQGTGRHPDTRPDDRGGGDQLTTLPADQAEARRRVQEGLCVACSTRLPEDAAYHRQHCSDRCRLRYWRHARRHVSTAAEN